jgi:hypothetical protein
MAISDRQSECNESAQMESRVTAALQKAITKTGIKNLVVFRVGELLPDNYHKNGQLASMTQIDIHIADTETGRILPIEIKYRKVFRLNEEGRLTYRGNPTEYPLTFVDKKTQDDSRVYEPFVVIFIPYTPIDTLTIDLPMSRKELCVDKIIGSYTYAIPQEYWVKFDVNRLVRSARERLDWENKYFAPNIGYDTLKSMKSDGLIRSVNEIEAVLTPKYNLDINTRLALKRGDFSSLPNLIPDRYADKHEVMISELEKESSRTDPKLDLCSEYRKTEVDSDEGYSCSLEDRAHYLTTITPTDDCIRYREEL